MTYGYFVGRLTEIAIFSCGFGAMSSFIVLVANFLAEIGV
jgi:hypothetical protein